MKTNTRFTLTLLLVFLMHGCAIEEPAEPSWDVQSSFPVINTQYNALSLINEKSDAGTTGDNDILSLLYTENFETLEVGDTLTIPDTISVLNFSIGKHIEVPEFTENASQDLDAIFQESGIPDDLFGETEIPAPGFDNLQSREYEYSIQDFKSIQIANGGLNVTLNNNTGLRFENIKINVYNNTTKKQLLGSVQFGSIADGSSETQFMDLSGKRIEKDLITQIVDGFLPPQSNITINPQATMDLSVSRSSTFDFSEAETKITAQVARDTSQLTIVGDQLLELEEALLKKGTFSVELKNEIPIQGTATIKIEEATLNGNSLSIPFTIPDSGQTTKSNTVDLTGYRIVSDEGTTIEYTLELNIQSNDQFVKIKASDSIRATAMAKNLTGSYFKGRTKAIDYEIPEQVISVNAFEQIRSDFSLDLLNPKSEAIFYSSAGFAIEGTADFIAENTINKTSSEIKFNTGNIGLDIPKLGTQTLTFDSSNSNISDVFSILPNSASLRGDVTVNPDQELGEVYDTSTVRLSLDILVPLALSIDSISASDTSDVDISQTEDFSELALTVISTNGLPLNAKFRLTFYDSKDKVIKLESGKAFSLPRADSAMAGINSSPVKISSVNSDFYESNGFSKTTQVFELNNEELRALESSSYAISSLKANTKTSGSSPATKVILKTTDILNIRAVGRVSYKVNQDQ